MASAVLDRITRLSRGDNVDVEASVTRYCNALPHNESNFPGAQVIAGRSPMCQPIATYPSFLGHKVASVEFSAEGVL
jgi:hypothetical protein